MYRFPVDYIAITQGYHDGKALDFGWYGHHNQPIYSCADGKVYKTEVQKTGGNVIFIKHNDGNVSCYGHLQTIKVKKNQKVKLGQQIGTMGKTGQVTGEHLHFQITSKGKDIYSKADIDPFEVCLVYPMQNVCQSGTTKQYLSKFKYLDDKKIWEKGDYILLENKAIRKNHTLGNNIIKVKECDSETKKHLTSKLPNNDAYLKKGSELKISDIYTQGKRVWGAYGNCWIVLCNIDGKEQAKKLK